MNVQSAYNEWSSTYDCDHNATRDLDQLVLKRMLGRRHFESTIEAGCGTGKNTALLARLSDHVHALDFSPGMIGRAQQKLREIGNVTFSVVDLTKRWPCAASAADLVTCNLVLEHVSELSPVFKEASRALVQQGLFFISELHPFRQYEGTVANFNRNGRNTKIPAFVHHVSEFLDSGQRYGFKLRTLREWWHATDEGRAPRLVSLLFERQEKRS